MKTIYLHIGTPKTGTTALQKILASNRRLLLEKGYFYPPQGIPSHASGHHCLAWSLRHPDGSRIDPYVGQRFEFGQVQSEVLDAIRTQATENIILSSELFSSLREDSQIRALRNLLVDFHVVVVVYLRRQDYFFLSLYSEKIKKGYYAKSFHSFCQEFQITWDYSSLLSRWQQVFGHANVIVRRYQENMDRTWLIDDFLKTLQISLEETRLKYTSRSFNMSLSAKSLRLIQFLNHWLLARFHLPYSFCKRFYLLPLQRPKIIQLVQWLPDWLLSNTLINHEDRQVLLAQYPSLEEVLQDACDSPCPSMLS